MQRTLLAKSTQNPNKPKYNETLTGHLDNACESIKQLLDLHADDIMYIFGFKKYTKEHLRKATMIAALLHDIGKANSHFQKMVIKKQKIQAYRHEVLSCFFISKNDVLKNLLLEDYELLRNFVYEGLLGHHFKSCDIGIFKPREGSGDFFITLYEKEILDTINNLTNKYNLNKITTTEIFKDHKIDLNDELKSLKNYIFKEETNRDSIEFEDRVFSLIVRALLVSADISGSALPLRTDNISSYIEQQLTNCCDDTFMDHIIEKSLNGNTLKEFQKKTGKSQHRINLLLAGCGGGKTLAAYFLIKNHGIGKKAVICYPTTGTATEGYIQYLSDTGLEDTMLVHSRNKIDLTNMLKEEMISNGGTVSDEEILNIVKDKTDAIKMWSNKITTCTVDFVLGLMHNSRKAMMAFPSLCNTIFVFDEIHNYDETLFSSLLDFLKTFRNAKVLLMTATLSQIRIQKIKDVADELGEEINIITGEKKLENQKRYLIKELIASDYDICNLVKNKYEENNKILFVANTVERCNSYYYMLEKLGFNTTAYHARFKYKDIIEKRIKIVSDFNFDNKNPCIGVTTQTCEQSLNISAHVLLTEICPIAALIQRLGRLNRFLELMFGECYILPLVDFNTKKDISPLPYKSTDIVKSMEWLSKLPSSLVSQTDITDIFHSINIDADLRIKPTQMANTSIFQTRSSTRNSSPTISVIMAEDLKYCYDYSNERFIDGFENYIIVMYPNKKHSLRDKIGYCFIAPTGTIIYNKETGAHWT